MVLRKTIDRPSYRKSEDLCENDVYWHVLAFGMSSLRCCRWYSQRQSGAASRSKADEICVCVPRGICAEKNVKCDVQTLVPRYGSITASFTADNVEYSVKVRVGSHSRARTPPPPPQNPGLANNS